MDTLYPEHFQSTLLETCSVSVLYGSQRLKVQACLERQTARQLNGRLGRFRLAPSRIMMTQFEIIMHRRHNNSISARFHCISMLVDRIPSLLNDTSTFDQAYSVCFLKAQTRDIAKDLAASHCIQDAILTTCLNIPASQTSDWKFPMPTTSLRVKASKKAESRTFVSHTWLTIQYLRSSLVIRSYLSWLQTTASTVTLFPLLSSFNFLQIL